MPDVKTYDLQRFVAAQAGIFEQARAELQAGEKHTHWMWFIFPQLRGLGSSAMATRYAIASHAEAKSYLDHPLLGPRLSECAEIVTALTGHSIEQIFGYPDNLKFHSSMTLFAAVLGKKSVFAQALQKYYSGKADEATLRLLAFGS